MSNDCLLLLGADCHEKEMYSQVKKQKLTGSFYKEKIVRC